MLTRLIPHPILSNEEMAALRHIDHRGWKSKVIDITFPRHEGEAGLDAALFRICEEASQAIAAGRSSQTASAWDAFWIAGGKADDNRSSGWSGIMTLSTSNPAS